MMLAQGAQASARVCGAHHARATPARASFRPRAVRARRHQQLARCAQDGAGTQLAAAQQLDAAAATMARLRSDLPFVVTRELVAEEVKYSFLAPLVTLSGRGDYLRVMSHWRQTVPQSLGSGWKVSRPRRAHTRCSRAAHTLKRARAVCGPLTRAAVSLHPQWEAVRVFQPDARTLVVRWRMTWTQTLFGLPLWQELPQVQNDDGAVSVSVARMVDSLKSAEKSLELGLSEVDASSAAAAALNDALRSLREGVQQSQALASEVKAAEAAVESLPGAGWLLTDEAKSEQVRAELAAMREDATSRVTGSSTFVLDADGRVVSHADMLDFDDVLSRATLDGMMQPEAPSSRVAATSTAASREAAAQEEREKEVATSKADALFQLCIALQLPESGSWQWRLDVIRQLLWESFIRDEDTDDEVRIAMTREDFDELVTLIIAAVTFVLVASTSYLAYWLVFVAPELPAQLSQFSNLAPGENAMRDDKWMSSLVSSLSNALQPSLFR